MRRLLVVSGSVAALAAAALVAYAVVTVAGSSATDYTPNQPQVRFTIAAGCPPRLARFGDVREAGSGLSEALVPLGTPTAGLVCNYRSLPRYSAALHSSVRLSPAAARELGAALAQVELKDAPGEVSCPAATGQFAVLVLAYPRRPDVDVRYELTGCQSLDNGVVQTAEVTNPSFYDRFAPAYSRVLRSG